MDLSNLKLMSLQSFMEITTPTEKVVAAVPTDKPGPVVFFNDGRFLKTPQDSAVRQFFHQCEGSPPPNETRPGWANSDNRYLNRWRTYIHNGQPGDAGKIPVIDSLAEIMTPNHEVTLNGKPLREGVDYSLDYETGIVSEAPGRHGALSVKPLTGRYPTKAKKTKQKPWYQSFNKRKK